MGPLRGFFLAQVFTAAVGLRAVVNFLFGVKQGWRVTEKGLERKPGWRQMVMQNRYVLGLQEPSLPA